MTERVRTYISQEIGLRSDAHVLIALSGGADSTALLLIMKQLGYKLHALHCNFHLRADESNRDQRFVESLCQKLEIPLSIRHFKTEEMAREQGVSIEMMARELRYEWFRQEMEQQAADCIAVAHHREDQAETILLNLLRGTGLRGLAGMHPSHSGVIRPLLCLSRQDILAYLERQEQDYVTDSTNQQPIAQRNRLRLDVFPLLQDIHPAAVQHLCMAAHNVRESLPYYFKGVQTSALEANIMPDSYPLSALGSPVLLHEWLSGKGFNAAQQGEMLAAGNKAAGRMWQSLSHKVVRSSDALRLYPLAEELPLPQLQSQIVPAIQETGPCVAYFDARLLKAPILVRPVRAADTFVPFGMKGRKLVSDYLTDRKVDRLQRARQFVATCGEDIVWLIGHRSDNRYRVTKDTTEILKVTWVNP